jgi:predicted dehydrogenase
MNSEQTQPRSSRAVVIGVAHWHLPLYRDALLHEHDVVGVSDADTRILAAVAGDFGAEGFGDWREMLDTVQSIDVAYILSRHDETRDIALELIARRIPFALEKPGALNLAQLAEIETASASANVPATVALVQRFGPVPELLKRVKNPQHFSFTFLAGPPTRYSETGNEWMLERELSGGGCLALLGVHFVDMFLLATGAPAKAVTSRALLQHSAHYLSVEDHALVALQTDRGESASLEIGWTYPESPEKRYVNYRVTGHNRFLAIGPDGVLQTSPDLFESTPNVVDLDADLLYAPFVKGVAETLSDRFAGMPTLTDLREAMQVIDSAYTSVHDEAADEAKVAWY